LTLRDLAHARAGDKGVVVNIAVIARDRRDFARIARDVTVASVKAHLSHVVVGDIVRYELPTLGALNFVFSRAPRDSVTQSLALDAHGKSLSSILLDLELSDDEAAR
jgi:hypothetical protein